MAIEITHIRFSGNVKNEQSIVRYKWRNVTNINDTGENDKPSLVAWVDGANNDAYVGSGPSRVKVGVIRPANTDPYLRTYADGDWSNNLLSLDTF